ncbi:MAG: ISNCY family transposase, partial [Oscillatoriales cyanobacterium C42_A2020_001]|nr:ISNCY family transposase [Leptolyngbyaceae cyanobacterium C42_A2020_001]
MEPMPLSFSGLLDSLQQAINRIDDPRQASNGTRYNLKDAILAAFSVFFMQCESFLEHQRQMQSRCGQDNAQTLFGLGQIPTVPQIRNILDQLAATLLFGVFEQVYRALRQEGYLQAYQCLDGQLLVTLDGTQYFSSQKIECQGCSTRTHKNGRVTYSHSVIVPVIVAPGQSQVITLAPEFVQPQDGTAKQDCELAAAKRWVQAHAQQFTGQPITLLGDDLYSHQPMCQQCLELGINFIFTALPDSHPALYERLHVLEVIGAIEHLAVRQSDQGAATMYHYRYTNLVPIRDSHPALLVNWCELVITREHDQQVLYRHAFVTFHRLSHD